MTENIHCRIGKVTRKKQPNLVVLPPAFRGLSPEKIQDMHESVDIISAGFAGNLAAIIIVGISFDGQFNRASVIDNNSPYGPTMIPAIVSEILRRDTIADVLESGAS